MIYGVTIMSDAEKRLKEIGEELAEIDQMLENVKDAQLRDMFFDRISYLKWEERAIAKALVVKNV